MKILKAIWRWLTTFQFGWIPESYFRRAIHNPPPTTIELVQGVRQLQLLHGGERTLTPECVKKAALAAVYRYELDAVQPSKYYRLGALDVLGMLDIEIEPADLESLNHKRSEPCKP